MKHRHLDTTGWSRDAIDSVLEYGDLPDWRELFAAARADRQLAAQVIAVASAHRMGGPSALATALARKLWPDLIEVTATPTSDR